jgi:hypothetical protein
MLMAEKKEGNHTSSTVEMNNSNALLLPPQTNCTILPQTDTFNPDPKGSFILRNTAKYDLTFAAGIQHF